MSLASSLTDARVVRFDTECVLIPECSHLHKRPRVVTKSYSLPLWRRRPQPTSDSECNDDTPTVPSTSSAALLSSSPEETHVVLKVPIPSFIRSSRSPPRGRSPSSSPTIPLSPCLVHRLPSGPPASHPNARSPPTRRPSLPVYQRRKDDLTVPLRACCQDCVPVTEKSLKEGSSWQEKFTKGARRRRSASLDNSHSPTYASTSTANAKPPFSPSLYDERMPPPTLSITVDEVDKRRRSQDLSVEEHPRSASLSSCIRTAAARGFHPFAGIHDRDPSTDSASSSLLTDDSERSERDPQLPKRKSSPIAEEDENELFPLPSPRRSPSASPSPSIGESPKPSRTPSPAASTACLHPSSAAASRSRDSLRSTGSEEVLTDATMSRRDKGKGKTHEAAVAFPGPTPSQGPGKALPTLVTSLSSNYSRVDTEPNSPTSPLSASSTSTQPKTPITPSSSPKVFMTGKHRKNSFTVPFLKATEAIRGASVDVLRGVSSIGGGGGGGGIIGSV